MRAQPQSVTVLIALLVCLIPTTIGGLLSAIGIAGMDRVMQRNVLAMSGRAVEAAGDVDTLLLDKTGTITLGNRQADGDHPAPGVDAKDAARVAYLSSLADETPEGRSIVAARAASRGRAEDGEAPAGATFVPFSAYTRMSGLDLADGPTIRKGAPDAVRAWVREQGGDAGDELARRGRAHRARGGTPLLLARNTADPRRHPPQGHPQAEHARALRSPARDGHSHRHDHRRQPAHRRRRSRAKPASTISSPRRRPRRRWRSSSASKTRAGSSR